MDRFRLDGMTLSEKAKIKIKEYIDEMDLSKNNKLPREEEFAKIIGISRVTLRTALNDLASEGLILRRQGKGTFVNLDSYNIKVKFNPVEEFTDMIRNSGYKPSVKLVSIQIVPGFEKIRDHLKLSSEDKLVMSEKIFFADKRLCSFCIDYFPLSAIGGEEAFDNFSKYENSIFRYIYSHSGREILWDKVKIKTVNGKSIQNLSTYVSDKKLSNKPFLLVKGINYDTDDNPLLYVEEYIDTDIIEFSMIRQREFNIEL